MADNNNVFTAVDQAGYDYYGDGTDYSDCWTFPREKIMEMLKSAETDTEALAALVEALDRVDAATMTIPSAQSAATYTLRGIKRSGHTVEIALIASKLTLTANAWNTIGVIPTAYRPSRSVEFLAVDYANAGALEARITEGGNLNVWIPAGTSTTQVRLQIVYIK